VFCNKGYVLLTGSSANVLIHRRNLRVTAAGREREIFRDLDNGDVELG